MTDLVSVHVRIAGRVQGVAYRAWTEREANRRGLSGWVRNIDGGGVEAVFSGPAEPVLEMILSCREGPRLAVVEIVDVLGAGPLLGGAFTIRFDR